MRAGLLKILKTHLIIKFKSFIYLKLCMVCDVLWSAAMPHPADELLPRLRSCNEFTQRLEGRRGQT